MTGYRKLKSHVLDLLDHQLPGCLTYHGKEHTLDVLNVCEQYIQRLEINEEDAYLLRIGALVHDVGFVKSLKQHEKVGADLAERIMNDLNMSPDHIEVVKGLVLATQTPQSPQTLLQRILCDADLDYLGRDDYPEISEMLFEELQGMNGIKSPEEWRRLQIDFLRGHQFHTPYAKAHREPKKQFWLRKIEAINYFT
jgi:uncharacterized protein